MNRSTFRTIKYMNGYIISKGQVYEWGRFQNTDPHTCTQLPLPSPTDIVTANNSQIVFEVLSKMKILLLVH